MDIRDLTAVQLGRKIKKHEIGVVEAVKASLDQIQAVEPEVHAYVTVDREGALARAAEVQKRIDAGELTGPLAGVPVAIKDNMCTEGMRTTCCSRILHNFVPTYTAEAVLNLERAGAVILGKTNMDEFAMGSTTETSAYGVTRNPWNTEHVPGGSSGGSCAAVAANECFCALGSDTGGSIRQPSSFCGVTGIKPTYGTVSRYGLIAYGSSLDQIGPIAKDVTDCATILEAIAGYDPKDSTSIPRTSDTSGNAGGLRAAGVSGSMRGMPRAENISGNPRGMTCAAETSERAWGMPHPVGTSGSAWGMPHSAEYSGSMREMPRVENISGIMDGMPRAENISGNPRGMTCAAETSEGAWGMPHPAGVPGSVQGLDFTSALVDDVRGMRIGIPRDYLGEGLDDEVRAAILAAAKVLEEKGAVVEEFDLSLVEYAIPAYYVIASAEASSNLARFDGVKYGYRAKEYEGLHNMYKRSRSEGFGPEVKRRIMLGSFVLSSGYYDAYYLKALRTKALIKQAFDKAFAEYDVILGPAAPTTAPRLGESLSDPLKMYLGDIYTISVNLAGLPGMTVPCGRDSKGLPIGLQLIGDCFMEKNIIRAGYAFEQSRRYEKPAIAGILHVSASGASASEAFTSEAFTSEASASGAPAYDASASGVPACDASASAASVSGASADDSSASDTLASDVSANDASAGDAVRIRSGAGSKQMASGNGNYDSTEDIEKVKVTGCNGSGMGKDGMRKGGARP